MALSSSEQGQLDRIEAMLEGICMGAECPTPFRDPPPPPRKKGVDERRHDWAEMIGMATESYAKGSYITVRIDAGDHGWMEAKAGFTDEGLEGHGDTIKL